jgi:hypothetical protein
MAADVAVGVQTLDGLCALLRIAESGIGLTDAVGGP